MNIFAVIGILMIAGAAIGVVIYRFVMMIQAHNRHERYRKRMADSFHRKEE